MKKIPKGLTNSFQLRV